MINRSLIRIKTVQILYSYLLTRSNFVLATPPSAEDSNDRQFAYTVYQDLILLLLKLSSVPLGPNQGRILPPDPGFKKNLIAKDLRQNPGVTEIIQNNRDNLAMFDSCLDDVLKAIQETSAYQAFTKRRKLQLINYAEFWNTILVTVIRKHKGIERVLRRHDNFSQKGFEEGINMLVDTISNFDDVTASLNKARKELEKSLDQAYNLYHALLWLPVVITETQRTRLNKAKEKYLPTDEDLNPNTRFIDNIFVYALESNRELQQYVENHDDANPYNWKEITAGADDLLSQIMTSDIYKEYMESEGGDYATDAHFWREIMRQVILPSDTLADMLEAQSVYWNDDLDIMGTFVLKTIRRFYASPDDNDADTSFTPGKLQILPKFMDEDAEKFGSELFNYVVDNKDVYRSYIDKFIDANQWDTERLAFMDLIIMMTAIAELINYPFIPVPVTMNEYIEIANDYSTAKSGQFANGILSNVIKYLNDEGIITKK